MRIANYNAQFRADNTAIGMSHHGNAGNSSTRGFGVFYWHASANGKKLAQMVLNEYKKEFPDMPIWGTGIFACVPGTWTDFYLVRETAAPFVLIEWEFFTNNAARKTMLTTDYRKRCGRVAAKAACRWYGMKFEDEVKPAVKPAAPKPAEKPKEEPKVTEQYKKDAQPSKSLAPEFKEAVKAGITDGTYPHRPVTREEAAVMAYRASKK